MTFEKCVYCKIKNSESTKSLRVINVSRTTHPLTSSHRTSARQALHLYGTPRLINEYKLKQYKARPSAGMRHGGRSNPTPAPSISSLRAHRLLALLTHSRPAPSLFTSGYMLCARAAQRRSRTQEAHGQEAEVALERLLRALDLLRDEGALRVLGPLDTLGLVRCRRRRPRSSWS